MDFHPAPRCAPASQSASCISPLGKASTQHMSQPPKRASRRGKQPYLQGRKANGLLRSSWQRALPFLSDTGSSQVLLPNQNNELRCPPQIIPSTGEHKQLSHACCNLPQGARRHLPLLTPTPCRPRAAVQACRYPPSGCSGLQPRRAPGEPSRRMQTKSGWTRIAPPDKAVLGSGPRSEEHGDTQPPRPFLKSSLLSYRDSLAISMQPPGQGGRQVEK